MNKLKHVVQLCMELDLPTIQIPHTLVCFNWLHTTYYLIAHPWKGIVACKWKGSSFMLVYCFGVGIYIFFLFFPLWVSLMEALCLLLMILKIRYVIFSKNKMASPLPTIFWTLMHMYITKLLSGLLKAHYSAHPTNFGDFELSLPPRVNRLVPLVFLWHNSK